MKKIILTILLGASYIFSVAQSASIKGIVFDSINRQNIVNASVSLLRQKDSILYKFSRSDTNGNFLLKNLSSGDYFLFVTHPAYENFIVPLHINDTSHVNINTLILTLRANILKEVTVHEQTPSIRIKGDTTEFIADSFKVRTGATVGEMLKKMPGITVNKDGGITAMGKKVNTVLVDGEEFFGNDPTMATKNLQAKAIAKVQVFDKKSDQSIFSGMDDGQRSKTINLELKEGSKKGYFGNLELGSSLNDKWNNNAMFNSFKNKRQLSIYGAMSSTDQLDQQQMAPFMSAFGTEYNNDFESTELSGNPNDDLNNLFYSDGLPKGWAGGLNYSNRFNDDKQAVNANYNYNKSNSNGYSNTSSQSILPDTTFFNNESSKTFSSRNSNSINATYEWQINNLTSIKVKANGVKGNSYGTSSFNSSAKSETGNAVNNSIRNMDADGDDENLQSYFLLRKKFKKPGRTISFSFEHEYIESNTEGYLYALNSFFDRNGNTSLKDTTDQKKLNETFSATFKGKVIYTQPLAKNLFVQLSYGFQKSSSDSKRLSFNKNINGKYDYLNDTFSNHYNFNVLANIAGIAFKCGGEKLTFTFGGDLAKENYDQKDVFKDSSIKRDFTNFFPKANIIYKFSEENNFSIAYMGNTKQPLIRQLQPVPDNLNPLNITYGNPLLKQEFDHNINLSLNFFNLSRGEGASINGFYSLQSNAIVSNSFTDTLGRTVYQYVNGNGNYSFGSGFNYFTDLEKLGMNINAGLIFNNSGYSNIVNYEKNTTKNTVLGFNLNLNRNNDDRYGFYYYGDINYNISTSSIRKDIETRYWIQEHDLGLTLTLPWKFELNNEVQATFQQKTEMFTGNNNVVLWNAYLGKKILKNDKGIIKIVAHDILNQNIGYSRYMNSNIIEETNYQSVARYFLLSFVWNFTRKPAN